MSAELNDWPLLQKDNARAKKKKLNTDKMANEAIVIEHMYNAPVEKVWKALTVKDEMKKWYFDLAEFRAEKGFEFSFKGGPTPERQYVHLCKITEALPNKKIAYSWKYEGYPGDTLVSFELFPEGGKTRVKLTHSGIESFAPAKNPDFDKKNFVEGWTHIMGTGLKEYLEK